MGLAMSVCDRCGGSVGVLSDLWGLYLRCMNCGFHEQVVGPRLWEVSPRRSGAHHRKADMKMERVRSEGE